MKKIKFVTLTLALLLLCSCSFKKDNLEDAQIYTTIYPIEYLAKALYGEHSTVESIYPPEVDSSSYKLSKKLVKKFSKGDLFIYNGKNNEKDIAKSLVNQNGNLIIIDVSNHTDIDKHTSELWINPKNYLVAAKNVKYYLSENLNSKYIIEDIEYKYDEFEEKVSLIEASLHSLGNQAIKDGKSVIVTSNDSFNFLEEYGFTVISLEDENNQKEAKLNTIKNNFKNGKYKYILTDINNNEHENIVDLTQNYNATSIVLNDFNGIDDTDYFNYMNAFMDNIKTIIS